MQFQAIQAILEAPRTHRHHRTWSRAAPCPLPALSLRCLFLLDFLRGLRSSQEKVASRWMTFQATEEMGLGAPPRFEQLGRPTGGQIPSSDDDVCNPAVVDRLLDPRNVGGRGSGRLRFPELGR